jgi:tetratricopeptide (TPR) repeat protein
MFKFRIKTVHKILCLGFFLLITFYIWMNLNPTYTTPNIDKVAIEYEDAVNDPLKTEEKLLQRPLITTATTNIQLYPNDSQYYFDRAKHYVDLARQDLAIPDYTKAIGLDPKNVFYYWGRGRAYWVISQYQKSLNDYDKAIELEIPEGLKRNTKVTLISAELDQLREERKELLEYIK